MQVVICLIIRDSTHCVCFSLAGHVLIKPSILPWAPQIVHRKVPSNAIYAAQPVAVYASTNDFIFNFGHALFDFLYPVFNMLQTLRLYTPDFKLLLAQHQVISTVKYVDCNR